MRENAFDSPTYSWFAIEIWVVVFCGEVGAKGEQLAFFCVFSFAENLHLWEMGSGGVVVEGGGSTHTHMMMRDGCACVRSCVFCRGIYHAFRALCFEAGLSC